MDYRKTRDKKIVESNYADSGNLSTRISLHQKYSTNPYGWSDWVYDQYQFTPGCRILELGCGNGGFWDSRISLLPAGAALILSDISNGMLDEVATKFADCAQVEARKIDITDIPFEDGSFDFVIANHMLYHVPDLDKAIGEVHRVLKPDGVFYATTTGDRGISEYLNTTAIEILGNPVEPSYMSFSLQNGRGHLGKWFRTIDARDYPDSLLISDINDWLDYIFSMSAMAGVEILDRSKWFDYYTVKRDSDGLLHVPKENGMFISKK